MEADQVHLRNLGALVNKKFCKIKVNKVFILNKTVVGCCQDLVSFAKISDLDFPFDYFISLCLDLLSLQNNYGIEL